MKKFFLLTISLIIMSGFVEYSLNSSMRRINTSTCDTENLRSLPEKYSRNNEENCPCCVASQKILKFYVTNISKTEQTIEKIEVSGKEGILYKEHFECDRLIFEIGEKKPLYIYLSEELGEIETTDFGLELKVFFKEELNSETIEDHKLDYVFCK